MTPLDRYIRGVLFRALRAGGAVRLDDIAHRGHARYPDEDPAWLRQRVEQVARAYLSQTRARVTPPSRSERTAAYSLDPETVRAVLGPAPHRPDAFDRVRAEVACALFDLHQAVAAGRLGGVRLVRGRPLGEWLDLDTIADLLRTGSRRGRG